MTRAEFRDDGIFGLVILVCMFLCTYFSMMETFFMGGLFLPVINGPNEGNFAVGLMGVLNAYYGSSIWFREIY